MAKLNYALHRRESYALGRDPWISLTSTAQPGTLTAFLNHAVRLPALLQKADKLCADGTADRAALATCASMLFSLETRLTSWLTDHYNVEGYGSAPFKLVPIITFAGSIPGSHYAPQSAYEFDTFVSANFHTLYWCHILLLRSSVLDIVEILEPSKASELRMSVHTYATSLCQSVPYLMSSAGGNIAMATTLRSPLLYARRWFERGAFELDLAWCDALESHALNLTSGVQWDNLIPLSHLVLALAL